MFPFIPYGAFPYFYEAKGKYTRHIFTKIKAIIFVNSNFDIFHADYADCADYKLFKISFISFLYS